MQDSTLHKGTYSHFPSLGGELQWQCELVKEIPRFFLHSSFTRVNNLLKTGLSRCAGVVNKAVNWDWHFILRHRASSGIGNARTSLLPSAITLSCRRNRGDGDQPSRVTLWKRVLRYRIRVDSQSSSLFKGMSDSRSDSCSCAGNKYPCARAGDSISMHDADFIEIEKAC